METAPTSPENGKPKKKWRYFFYLALCLLVVRVVPDAALNYSGYCAAQGRWLADEEFLASALRGKGAYIGFIAMQPAEKAYLKENPQCCRLYRGNVDDLKMASGAFVAFLSRISGDAYASAAVQFKLKKSSPFGRDGDYYEGVPMMNTCGVVLDWYEGTSIEKKNSVYKDGL